MSASHHADTTSNAQLAALAVPVLVHTALGPVIDVGGSHFPVKAAPAATPAPSAASAASAAAPSAAAPSAAASSASTTPASAPVATAAPPAVAVSDSNSTDTADWACIRDRESGDRYNDPSAPSGAYGILLSTWQSFGYSGWPYEAAPAVQDALALRLYDEDGWTPWSSRFSCGL